MNDNMINESRMTFPRTEVSSNNVSQVIDIPEVDLTLETGANSEHDPSEETKQPSSELKDSSGNSNQQKLKIYAPIQIERPQSVISLIQSGDLRVVPLIGIDFSIGNIAFDDQTIMHSTNPSKPNDYRGLLRMLSHAYRNILNLPIFGYGAKTSSFSNKSSHLFPLSRFLRNPFIPNDENSIDQTYSDCLSTLELSVPVNVTPLVNFFKKVGETQDSRLKRKSAQ